MNGEWLTYDHVDGLDFHEVVLQIRNDDPVIADSYWPSLLCPVDAIECQEGFA